MPLAPPTEAQVEMPTSYVKNFLDSKEPKENSGSFSLFQVSNHHSEERKLYLKSSFNYKPSWANKSEEAVPCFRD